MYKRIVGVVISAILIDENSVTQVKNEGITIEWNDIRKIRLIPYNIFYCDSYLAIYGSKAINGNKQSIIRIGRKRENYENAWIAIADFVMENKPDIILPERFVKEIEEMKKSNNTPV